MRRLGFVLVCALLTGLASPAFAQQEKGDSEVAFNGSFTSTFGDFGVKAFQIFAAYGYFYTKSSEILGGVTGSITSTPSIELPFIGEIGGGTSTDMGGFVGYRYNFAARDKLVPYVGGNLFVSDFSPPQGVGFGDVVFADGQAGAKYYLNRNVALDLNASFGFGSDVVFTARFGLAYLFSRGTP